MAATLGYAFDASAIDPNSAFDPLPAGSYNAIIIDSDMLPTKAGGQYLKLTFQVIDGPYQNRMFWDQLNLFNSNQTAVDIAQRTLSAICHAVGVYQLPGGDTSVLFNRPLTARLVVKQDPQYGDKNEVKGYKPMAAMGAQPPQMAHAQPPQQAAAPWGQPQQPAQMPAQQPAPQPIAAPPQNQAAQPATGTPPWARAA